MQYSDIQSLVYQLTKTNSSSLTAANLNLFTQPAEDRVASLLMRSDSRWQYDDFNQADLPIATTSLVSGQQDYSLSTSHLTIDRVEILDNTSNWQLLKPIDPHDVREEAMGAHLNISGVPLEYDKIGSSIFLYPIPNYSLSAALKLYFTRGPLKFDYTTGKFTDGTGSTASTPGYNSLFHPLVALYASEMFCIVNGRKNVNFISAKITDMEQKCVDFFGSRSRDERPRFGVATDGVFGNKSGVLSRYASDSNR